MVLSKINNKVSYKETKTVDEEDVGHASPIYSMPIFNTDVAIVLGKPKYQFASTKEVVYYPIYLLSKNKIHPKISATPLNIGVFEINTSKVLEILDEDGDVELSKMDDPLLFDFVNETYVSNAKIDPKEYEKTIEKSQGYQQEENVKIPFVSKKSKSDKAKESQKKDEDDNDEEDDKKAVLKIKRPMRNVPTAKKQSKEIIEDGIFTKNKSIVIPLPLKEETEQTSNEIKTSYKEMTNHNWLQKFTRNINYSIIDNEGGGDCFFAVIRDAYASIGERTTVTKLRALLASEATPDIFEENHNLYMSFEEDKKRINAEMQEIKKTLSVYKKRYETMNIVEQKEKIKQEMGLLNDKYKDLQLEYRETVNTQFENVGSMKDISTFNDFIRFIQTSEYWANEWAISTLEVLLNIKIIILSQLAYESNAYDNILNCGEVSRLIPEDSSKGIIGHNGVQYPPFHPKKYIITSYTGDHYKLVSYKNRSLLSFEEIPYDMKILVVNKCLERNAGVYNLIPEFRNFKLKMLPELAEEENKEEENENQVDCDENNENSVIFVYHSSAFDAKIGKGNGEKIEKAMIPNFIDLNKMKDWRKKLDDMWVSPFSFDDHRWCSVENYVQGSKFKKNHTEFYSKFSLDSNSDISKDPKLAKQVGTQKSKRPKEVKIDPDYELGRSEIERENAVRSKFQQNEDLKQILLATKNACIKHFQRGSPSVKDDILIKVRSEISMG